MPGVEKTPIKYGSPSFPAYGYDLRLLRESDASEAGAGEKAVVAIVPPLPPGCMTHHLGRRRALREDLFLDLRQKLVYSTFDWGIRDEDGYYFILGRTDDVINVAGHRLGTREIEEAVNMHAEHRRVRGGRALPIRSRVRCRWRLPLPRTRRLDSAEGKRALEKEVMETVDKQLGAIARPRAVHFVTLLPKTRSGKTLRRSIQALAEGRDPGDLTTIEDPDALEQIRQALRSMKTDRC